jgi:CRISPR-associated protein Cas2
MVRFLVAYDIVDDGTRNAVSDLLEAHGIRVQRSLFELTLKHRRTMEILMEKIAKLIDPEVDSVRVYAQCAQCLAKAKELGRFPEAFRRNAVYFF